MLPADLTDGQLDAAAVLASIETLLDRGALRGRRRRVRRSDRFVRILVDTGVSASISRRRRDRFVSHVRLIAGHQIFLVAVTVAELRYGALVAGWEDQRRGQLEQSIAATTVVPVSNALLWAVAEVRHHCRKAGHALHEPARANDLWISASGIHIGAPLLTADAVFNAVPGLSLHRWLAGRVLGRHSGTRLGPLTDVGGPPRRIHWQLVSVK